MHVNHNTDEYFVLINSHQFDRYEILFFICTCKYVVQNLFSPSNNLLKIDIFTLLKIITIIYRFYLYFNFHAKSGKHKQIKCFLHCILLYGATRLTHGVPIVISQKISRVYTIILNTFYSKQKQHKYFYVKNFNFFEVRK